MQPLRSEVCAGALAEIPDLMALLDSHTSQFGPYDPKTITVAHRLAIAFWGAGDIDQAVGILHQALNGLTPSLEQHPVGVDLMCTLGEIMVEQGQLEQAGVIYREVLERCIRQCGENHPRSLAAKGDLAQVLFDLGRKEEATQMERQACEGAQIHLGKTHSVTCVLAWNRALRYESGGETDFARTIIATELTWLFTEDAAGLCADQRIIRTMLARRFPWHAAGLC